MANSTNRDPGWRVLIVLLLLAVIVMVMLCGCSTANNWRPQQPSAPSPQQYQVCVQYGSKMYDRDTGEECLTREQQRRKDREGVHHAGAPR